MNVIQSIKICILYESLNVQDCKHIRFYMFSRVDSKSNLKYLNVVNYSNFVPIFFDCIYYEL